MFRLSSIRRLIAVGIIAILVITLIPVHTGYAKQEADDTVSVASAINDQLGKLPLAFVPNRGQVDPQVQFQVSSSSGTLFFTSQKVIISLPYQNQHPAQNNPITVSSNDEAGTAYALHIEHEGASPVSLDAAGLQPSITNYLIGNDPSRWHTNIPNYGALIYRDMYPGVDVRYDGHSGLLKSTYFVAAGADADLIRWHYEGASSLHIDPQSRDLIIDLPTADSILRGLVEQRPIAWQELNGKRQVVDVDYVLYDADTVGFRIGDYDVSLPLVIDPALTYSTYLGGISSERLYDIAVNGTDVYATGQTGSFNFPTTAGAFVTAMGGPSDAFVTHLNGAGTALVYSTYLGGTTGAEKGTSIVLDGAGNAYVTGETFSTDFPTTVGAFQTAAGGGQDAFVVQLNPTGTALIFGTYLGGAGDEFGDELALSGSNIYVTGSTNAATFPTTTGPAFGGGIDAFVTELAAGGGALVYSRFLGAVSTEQGLGIAVDGAGNTYICGITFSVGFPTTVGAFQTVNPAGINNGFVAEFDPTGAVLASTYLGGTGQDGCVDLALDATGPYVVGLTNSVNFPTALAAGIQPALAGGFDGFVTHLNTALTGVTFSTYYGGATGDESIDKVAIDTGVHIYMVGKTSSTDLPLGTITPYIQAANAGPGLFDAFAARINLGTASLAYGTYFGGASSDDGGGAAVNPPCFYFGGTTSSSPFPVTAGAFQTAYGGGASDTFLAKIGEPVYGSTPVAPGGAILVGTTPVGVPVSFVETVQNLPIACASLTVGLNGGSVATAITGVNAADFTITSPAFPITNLAIGASVPVTIQCTPSAAGLRTATLTLTTNDVNQPVVTYALTCNATVASVVPPPAGGAAGGDDIEFEFDTSDTPIFVGEEGTYTVFLSNRNSGAISGVLIRVGMAEELEILSVEAPKGTYVIDCNVITITIGTLNPGESVTIAINTQAGNVSFADINGNSFNPNSSQIQPIAYIADLPQPALNYAPRSQRVVSVAAARWDDNNLRTKSQETEILGPSKLPSTGQHPDPSNTVDWIALAVIGLFVLTSVIVVRWRRYNA